MTKAVVSALLTFFILVLPQSVNARNDILRFDVAAVMDNPEYAARLQGVTFYWGDSPYPTPAQNYGEFRTNKKTNAFNKSDIEACEWVLMSALLQLKAKALELGGNAVVNVISNYKNNQTSSRTEYTCGAGNVVAGVALIGTVVRID